jgi:choice-of-anchor C domain-containing protein
MKSFIGVLASIIIVPSVSANLIVNGDFESPAVNNIAAGFDTYMSGQTFPGWTVGGDSVDIVCDNSSSWVWWKAASGHQSVDLNGNGPGSVFQEVATIPGQAYQLSFALAANAANAPSVVTMEFLWQDEVVGILSFLPRHDQNDPGWRQVEYELMAPTTLARLTFGSLVPWDTAGAAIDNVVLELIPQAVPDSTGAWLVGALFLPAVLRFLAGKGGRFAADQDRVC